MSILDRVLNTNKMDFTHHQQSTGDLLKQLIKNHQKEIKKIKKPEDYGMAYIETTTFYIENFIYRYRDVFKYYQISTTYPRQTLKRTIRHRIKTAKINFEKKLYQEPSEKTMNKIGQQITSDSQYTANTGGMILMIPYLTDAHFLETAESVIDRVIKETQDTVETPHEQLKVFKTLLNRAKHNRLIIK